MIGSSLSEVYFQFLCNYKEYLDSLTPFYKLLCTTETEGGKLLCLLSLELQSADPKVWLTLRNKAHGS